MPHISLLIRTFFRHAVLVLLLFVFAAQNSDAAEDFKTNKLAAKASFDVEDSVNPESSSRLCSDPETPVQLGEFQSVQAIDWLDPKHGLEFTSPSIFQIPLRLPSVNRQTTVNQTRFPRQFHTPSWLADSSQNPLRDAATTKPPSHVALVAHAEEGDKEEKENKTEKSRETEKAKETEKSDKATGDQKESGSSTDKPEETMEHDAEIAALSNAASLKKIYESKFTDRAPKEVVDWIIEVATKHKATLQDPEAKESPEKNKQKLAVEQAVQRLRRSKILEDEIDKMLMETKASPQLIQKAEAKFATPLKTQATIQELLTKSDSVEQTTALLATQTDYFKSSTERLKKIESAMNARNARITDVPSQRKLANKRLEASLEQLAKLGFDHTKIADSRILTQLSIGVFGGVEVKHIQAESDRDAAVARLYSLQRDIEQRLLAHNEEVRNQLASQLTELKRIEKEKLADETRLEAAMAHPSVKALANHNVELVERSTKMSLQNEAAQLELESVKQQLADLKISVKKLENKVEVAGATQTVGMLLRKFRRDLPSISQSYRRVTQIKADLPLLQLALIEFEEQREMLNRQRTLLQNSPADKQQVLNLRTESFSGQQTELKIAPEVREMALNSLDKQVSVLNQLIVDYEKNIELLSELELQIRSLVERTNKTRFYIDKHVLWIRSAEPLAISDASESARGVLSVLAVQQWSDLYYVIVGWFKARPYHAIFGFLLVIGLITFKGRLSHRLRRINKNLSQERVTSLVRSLLLSFLIAAIYPAVILTAGLLLRSPYDTSSLKGAASAALLMLVSQVLMATTLYQFLIRDGLAETRLHWDPILTRTLRRMVATMAFACFPLMFIFQFMNLYNDGRWESSLGRIALIGAMLILGIANLRGFRGVIAFFKQSPVDSVSRIIVQSRWLWLILFVIGPVMLAAFAAMGYAYSAVQLGNRIMLTFWVALLTIFAFSILMKITNITERAILNRIRRRSRSESSQQVSSNEHEEEIANTHQQISRLLRVSAILFALLIGWQIWSPIFPAVQVLDKVHLWKATAYVAEAPLDDQQSDAPVMIAKQVDITLNHAMLCCMIFGITYAISRNLPGLLELVFLNRLPIDRGGKYAIAIVLRYLVAITGAIFGFRMIGFSWDSVQWLVAAMSVGLGFGLQEIFANFVSGLIILLERPVRIGDMVVVNGTTGWISRIQLRATTVTDLNHCELIIPNKKFITDDVTNLTLTDRTTRVVIPVGVAYGSDTELAQSTLLSVARKHAMVLSTPVPAAHFTAFGASSLDFELRVFIPNRETFYQVQHELHMSIDAAFRDANIEIAFPQQDLHIRSTTVPFFPHENSVADNNEPTADDTTKTTATPEGNTKKSA